MEKQVEDVRQQELKYDKLIEIGQTFSRLFNNLTLFIVSFCLFGNRQGFLGSDEHPVWCCNC